MITGPELRLLLQFPIAFHRVFSQIGGGVTAGLLLSQLFYLSNEHADEEGWFYHSAKRLQEETTLTRTEFDNARKKLAATGIVEEDLRGVPAQLHWRIDIAKLAGAISETSQTSLQETRKLDGGEPAKQSAGKPQSLTLEQTKKQNIEDRFTHITRALGAPRIGRR